MEGAKGIGRKEMVGGVRRRNGRREQKASVERKWWVELEEGMGGGNRRHGWMGQKARVEVEKDIGRKDRRDIKYECWGIESMRRGTRRNGARRRKA